MPASPDLSTDPSTDPSIGSDRPEDRLLADIAVTAARAGAAAAEHRRRNLGQVTTKSSPTDPVTAADHASQQAILRVLAERRPADAVLGEEGAELAGTSDLRWVIDPIDGTVNFIYSIPHSAVSVACQRATGAGWIPVAAAVLDLSRQEIFSAVRGGGAFLDGRALRVRRPAGLAESLIGTGFSYQAATRTRQLGQLADLIARVRDIRSSGSAALDLCWVAAGRLDGYYEDELAVWDHAAGWLIATEAGATVSAFGTGVIAGSAPVHDGLRQALTASG